MLKVRDITGCDNLIHEALGWMQAMPRWWHVANEAIAKLTTRGPLVAFGVWDNDEFTAVIVFQQIGPYVMETHLDCKRGTRPEIIIAASKLLAEQVFASGFHRITTLTVTLNRSLTTILNTIGFSPTGATIQEGQVGNRPLYWNYMELVPTSL